MVSLAHAREAWQYATKSRGSGREDVHAKLTVQVNDIPCPQFPPLSEFQLPVDVDTLFLHGPFGLPAGGAQTGCLQQLQKVDELGAKGEFEDLHGQTKSG